MAADDHTHDAQFKQYKPKAKLSDWDKRQLGDAPIHAVGSQYVGARRSIGEMLDRGYDVKNLKGLTYRGAGENSYIEHQALITQEHVMEYHQAAEVLHHVHGINAGAIDFFDQQTRTNYTARRAERKARGIGRSSTAETHGGLRYDPGASRRILWKPGDTNAF